MPLDELSNEAELAPALKQALLNRLSKDAERGFTSIGPKPWERRTSDRSAVRTTEAAADRDKLLQSLITPEAFRRQARPSVLRQDPSPS